MTAAGDGTSAMTPAPHPVPPAIRFKFEVSNHDAGVRVAVYVRSASSGSKWELRGKLMLKPQEWLAMALAMMTGADATGTWGDQDITTGVEIEEVSNRPIAAASWRAVEGSLLDDREGDRGAPRKEHT